METEIKKSKNQKKTDKISLESEEGLILEEESVLDDSKTQQEIQEETTEAKEQQNEYIYVYGIINNKNLKLGIKGLKNMPILKIDFKDISALTSFYPTLKAILKEDEAMMHADILKKIAEKTTVIPTSFGTVFKDQEILETVLSKSYQAIKHTLSLINGKIELGLKVVKQRKSEISINLKNKSFSNNELGDVNNGVATEILQSLDNLSIKNVKGDNFSDRLLLNHSFLIEKNKFSKFSEEIAKMEKKYNDLKFVYTGPWPPYSFVNIKISGS